VERGKNKVSGQRGLDRDFRGLEVSDFSDEDNVGSCRRNARNAAAKFSPI